MMVSTAVAQAGGDTVHGQEYGALDVVVRVAGPIAAQGFDL